MINSGICTGVLHCAGQHPLRWQGIILGPTVFMQANNRKLYLNIIAALVPVEKCCMMIASKMLTSVKAIG